MNTDLIALDFFIDFSVVFLYLIAGAVTNWAAIPFTIYFILRYYQIKVQFKETKE